MCIISKDNGQTLASTPEFQNVTTEEANELRATFLNPENRGRIVRLNGRRFMIDTHDRDLVAGRIHHQDSHQQQQQQQQQRATDLVCVRTNRLILVLEAQTRGIGGTKQWRDLSDEERKQLLYRYDMIQAVESVAEHLRIYGL